MIMSMFIDGKDNHLANTTQNFAHNHNNSPAPPNCEDEIPSTQPDDGKPVMWGTTQQTQSMLLESNCQNWVFANVYAQIAFLSFARQCKHNMAYNLSRDCDDDMPCKCNGVLFFFLSSVCCFVLIARNCRKLSACCCWWLIIYLVAQLLWFIISNNNTVVVVVVFLSLSLQSPAL